MRVHLFGSPPARQAPSERETIARWSQVLEELGHAVSTARQIARAGHDLLIALGPSENAGLLAAHAEETERPPLAIALNGLDPEGHELERPQVVRALAYSEALVAFEGEGRARLTSGLHARTRIVPRPALPAARPSPNRAGTFEVMAFGDVRDKEPVASARVARALPAGNDVQVLHAGSAIDEMRRMDALREHETNPSWRWLGNVPRAESVAGIARSRVLLQLEHVDELANPITEAIAAGVGVIASAQACNVGLLGREHPGLVEPGDDATAAAKLARARRDRSYLQELRDASVARASEVTPAAERKALRSLVSRLARSPAGSSRS